MTGTVRLMTANILHRRGATAASLATAVESVQPDILAVQELTPPVVPAVEDRFLRTYVAAPGAESAVGMAAVRPVSWGELPMPRRNGVVATLDPAHWPEFTEPVEIVAIHLRNPIGGLPWSTAGDRRHQIRAVEELVAGSTTRRRVVCGDMNATPRWPAYRRLVRSLDDGVAAAEDRPPPTWGPLRNGPRLLRIDHVLVDGITVVSSQTIRIEGSDHDAVVVDLAEAP